MKLKHVLSGKLIESSIEVLSSHDYKKILSSKEFSFDWNIETSNEVYKTFLIKDDKSILGLVSLIDMPDDYRIHLNLLEVSKSNQGKDKKYDFIAGCLIAYAAELAFKRAYYGFVSLEPKTVLIKHYQDKYGFIPYGRYLAIEGIASQKLINKYLKDE